MSYAAPTFYINVNHLSVATTSIGSLQVKTPFRKKLPRAKPCYRIHLYCISKHPSLEF